MRLPKNPRFSLAVMGLLVILVIISILQFNQWRKRREIQKEINHITQQQREYEQKNKELEESLNLLNTKNYKEKIAREQLNLKKDGEIVVNFPSALPGSAPVSETGQIVETNPQKWWRYFFAQ